MSTDLYHIRQEIFDVNSAGFEALALKIFSLQYALNPFYNQYCKTLNISPADVHRLEDIVYLPIQFFKSWEITTTQFQPESVFESSGTTGASSSKHRVKDLQIYQESFLRTLNLFYGDLENVTIIGLLPSYLERGNSSLVYMVNDLIKRSKAPLSGFYLDEDEKLYNNLLLNEQAKKKTLLIGVTYALLDFTQKFQPELKNTIVMETGGMKGRKKELTRQEVHETLKQRLGLNEIHSEYGMTELLSQAYSPGNGIFRTPPWMKMLTRAEDDPFDISSGQTALKHYSAGAMNIIDLANLFSCSFIATDDVGKLYGDGSFEILGRMDNSDIRGCGLMVL